MNLFDMDGLYCGPEDFGPQCPGCGYDLEWEDCDACDGDGGYSRYESDPIQFHPDDWRRCDQCEGHGGWYMCYGDHTEEEGRRHCWLPNELPKEEA